MANRTSLRLRVLPRFPSRITADTGLKIVNNNPGVTIEPDFGALTTVPSVASPDVTFFWGWDQSQNTYSRISFQNIIENIQDVIIGPTLAATEAADPEAGQLVYYPSLGTAATIASTAYGRDLLALANAAAGRTALGLGTASTANVGTTAGTVAAGDDSRIVGAVQTTRTLTAGTGIATIGDLSANRTIALNAASIASLAKADTAAQPGASVVFDSVFARSGGSGTVGTSSIRSGDATHTGYLDFRDKDGNRHGYIGNSDTTAKTLFLEAEPGSQWSFVGGDAPLIDTLPIVAQTQTVATSGVVAKNGVIANGATANSIIGDPGDGSPISSALFATATLPFYSVGGYVPGPHMYGNSIITMRTVTDDTAQEQALAVQFINETGRPASPGSGSINNGKSGFTVHGRAVNGGGNMWGSAIALDFETGYDHGFGAVLELDINNRNKNSTIGGDFNVAGLFMNSISEYTSTAGIWQTGYDGQPNPTWIYGMFFQGEKVVKSAVIFEDTAADVVLDVNGIGTTADSGKNAHATAVVRNKSTAPYLILDQGYHQNGTIRDESNAPVGLDIAGTKGAYAARFTDSAPIGLSVQGTRSTAAIDVSLATTGVSLNSSANQQIVMGQFKIYNNGAGKLFFRRASDDADLMSIDTNGNIRTVGTITPAVVP